MKRMIILMFVLIGYAKVHAQINITAQVIPPFSPYINTYVDNPNKIILTLTNTTNDEKRIKLWVRIQGDNGVSATTSSSYIPSAPIILPAFQTKFIDFNSAETQNYFDVDKIDLVGISKTQIVRNQALPEGNYTICVKAFDYSTGQQLSPDLQGCTAPFVIGYVDPSVLTQPACGSIVKPNEPQSILFSWTPPAVPTGNIKYEFTIKEVPNNLNPNDVIKRPEFPVIYSTTVTSITTILYTSVLPMLDKGKEYVWRIKCIDSDNLTLFKNSGYSDVCTFIYNEKIETKVQKLDLPGGNNTPFFPIQPIVTKYQGKTTIPAPVTISNVSGKLIYSWKSGTQTKYPMQKALIKLVVNYVFEENNNPNNIKNDFGSLTIGGISEGQEIAVTSTDKDGNFNFSFLSKFEFGKVSDDYNLGGGEFKQKGKLYRRARIVILNPHDQFYWNPVKSFEPNVNGVTNIGEVKAEVKYCKLKVTIQREGTKDNLLYGISNLELSDANVYLCRKYVYCLNYDNPSCLLNIFPKDDGLPDMKGDIPDEIKNLDIVAKGKSDNKGNIVFDRISYNDNPNFKYYIYVDFDKNKSGYYNYELKWGIQLFKRTYEVEGGIFTTTQGTGETYTQLIKVTPKFPRISGFVTDKLDNGKPVPNSLVTYKGLYVANKQHTVLCDPKSVEAKTYGMSGFFKNCSWLCSKTVYRYYLTQSDGAFEFDNLGVLVKMESGLTPVGPGKTLVVTSVGYDEGEFKAPTKMALGSQQFINASMSRGAKMNLKVIDGETNNPLQAYVQFVEDNTSKKCNSKGEIIDMPAKLLSYKQKMIISMAGYITDTFNVVVNKNKVDLGTFKLYTINRRIAVFVKDEDGKPVENAKVEILEVKGKCDLVIKGQNNECPLHEKTKKVYFMGNYYGQAKFSFENGGGSAANGIQYTIRVKGPNDSNYEIYTVSTTIPYSSKYKILHVTLKKAGCISGYVYAGKNNASPISKAKIVLEIYTPAQKKHFNISDEESELVAYTNPNGYYELKNVPLRDYPMILRAVKSSSNYVGDSFAIILKPSKNSSYYSLGPNNVINFYNTPSVLTEYSFYDPNKSSKCHSHNFYLTVFNDMDIANLMGFPIEVTYLKPDDNGTGATISGNFVDIGGNEQFSMAGNSSLSFSNIKIIPSQTIKNERGIPASEPASLPVKTNNNSISIQIFNSIDGKLEDKTNGITIDASPNKSSKFDDNNQIKSQNYGVIKGKVKILKTSYNQSLVAFAEDIYLAHPDIKNNTKMVNPIFHADKNVKKPVDLKNGFKICNSSGNPIKLSLPGFANNVLSDYDSSYFNNGEINLTVRIQTKISNIEPSNLNIAVSNIKLKKGVEPIISNNNKISFKMGNWTLNSNKFTLDKNGLVLNQGTISAGVNVPFNNLKINYDYLDASKAEIKLNDMKLAGVHPVNIISTENSLGLIDIPGGKKAWNIYVAPNNDDVAAEITNLPALNSGDKIVLSSISIRSNGFSMLTVSKADVTLKNILQFSTLKDNNLSVEDDHFTLSGSFVLNLPQVTSYSTTLYFSRKGNGLEFSMVNTDIVSFNYPTKLNHKFSNAPTLTNGMFTYGGVSQEPGVLEKVPTTFYYTNDSISVRINKGSIIPISGDRRFTDVKGGMRVENGSWTTFWFDGNVEGMSGVSDVKVDGKPQRMKFLVEGAVKADGQSISMKNVETPFGGMSWTYNFPESRLEGQMNVDMDISACKLKGQINTIVDKSGWFFGATGMVAVSGVGDLNFFGLFGDYPSYPTGFVVDMGDFKCLPAPFRGQVKGFLFVAGMHKDILPKTSIGIEGLLSVEFGVDIGLSTQIWKSFDASNSELGISLLARGQAYAKGESALTCSSVSASAAAEVSISGKYNGKSGEFDIEGCGSLSLGFEVKQGVPLLGVCPLPSVTFGPFYFPIGAKLTYSSVEGAKTEVIYSECSSQCN